MSDEALQQRVGLSIRAKLVSTIIVLVAGIVAFQVVVFPQRQSDASLRALESKAISVTKLAAHNAASGLEFDDADAVEQVFQGVATDPDFAYIGLLTETGDMLAAIHGELAPPHPAHQPYEGAVVREGSEGMVHIEVRVATAGGVTGHMVSGFSTATIRAQQQANLLLAGGTGAVIFLIGVLVALYLGQSLGVPMQRIARQAERVARGRIDPKRLLIQRSDELGQMAGSFDRMMEMMARIEAYLNVVADGDLTKDTGLDGDLAEALDAMVRSQRELVHQIGETSGDIRLVSQEMLQSSEALQGNATSQARAVDGALEVIRELLDATGQIATASEEVLDDAEEAHVNSLEMTDRIETLVAHTKRIDLVLEVIKSVAARVELLALNAALEGFHAGEAGKGFTLVASQMQALTVNVVKAVGDIRGLTEDIQRATTASVAATEGATQRALSTEQSAREINTIIQHQQVSAEAVSRSMADINDAIRQSVAASAQSADAARTLSDLSERLQKRVSRFKLQE